MAARAYIGRRDPVAPGVGDRPLSPVGGGDRPLALFFLSRDLVANLKKKITIRAGVYF